MSATNYIFHLPPVWLAESKTLVLEVSAGGEKAICLIPDEELQRRYNTRPGLTAAEAQAVFDTFRDEIELDVQTMLERPGLAVPAGPRVLQLSDAPARAAVASAG